MNPIIYATEGDVSTITIVTRRGVKYTATFDTDRLDKIKSIGPWHLLTSGKPTLYNYFCSSHRGGRQLLHRVLMDCPLNKYVNIIIPGYDYRRSNLQIVEKNEWLYDTSRTCRHPTYERFIYYNEGMERWQIKWNFHDGILSLGSYHSLQDAVTAREQWRKRFTGVKDVAEARRIKLRTKK